MQVVIREKFDGMRRFVPLEPFALNTRSRRITDGLNGLNLEERARAKNATRHPDGSNGIEQFPGRMSVTHESPFKAHQEVEQPWNDSNPLSDGGLGLASNINERVTVSVG